MRRRQNRAKDAGYGIRGGSPPAAVGVKRTRRPDRRELRVGLLEYRLVLSADALQPGTVTVTVTNAGSAGHDVRLRQNGKVIGATEVLSPGGKQTLRVDVAPGVPVKLDCTVGGHAEAGMQGVLAVTD